MTEFFDDVKTRSGLVRSAHRMGKHSKSCTLPHEHATKKELEKLNGECITYNLGRPMKWTEFKLMPEERQEEYLRRCVERGGGGDKIAEMFGVSRQTVVIALSRYGIKIPRGASRTMGAEWEAFVGAATLAAPEPAIQMPTGPDKPTLVAPAPRPMLDKPAPPITAPPIPKPPIPEDPPAPRPAPPTPPERPAQLLGGRLSFTGKKAAMLEAIYRIIPEDVTAIAVEFNGL